MGERLGEILAERKEKHKLLVPYLTFGYPSVPDFLDLVRICQEEGADALEVGIPYSDPVADGPIIQTTSYQALLQGVTPVLVRDTFAQFSVSLPLIAMTYGNIVFRYGVERFARDFSEVGFQGLIVADFPLEARPFLGRAHGLLEVILLLAVNSSEERIQSIAQESEGFIYLVSGRGVTGAAAIDEGAITRITSLLRSLTRYPVLVGFGIHSPEQGVRLAAIADGIIIGSTLLEFIVAHHGEDYWKTGFRKLIAAYRQALGV